MIDERPDCTPGEPDAPKASDAQGTPDTPDRPDAADSWEGGPLETAPVWNRRAILRRIEAVLDPDEFRQLERRLAGEIEDAEAVWLEHMVNAAAILPLPAPPEALSRELRNMFTARVGRERIEAILTNDSRIERELVGVRGVGDDDGWTLTYSTSAGNLLVDVWPTHDGFDVEAQLMAAAGGPEFTLTLTGPATLEAVSDRLGRAAVVSAPSGRYEVVVARPGMDIVATLELAS